MVSSVTALLVSHDGGRWLPAVIEGLQSQRTPVRRVVAVDTGSRDGSDALLEDAFGEVVRAPRETAFPAAVELGLARLREDPDPSDWVWILHDDANPDPGALAALLAAAAAHPDAAIIGPKLREWPSLRRLLELGVTISATGRRETGLERGEYDQGQHDEVRDVLAVNTAGMLIRRAVLEELGGFDPQLPIFGNDIDLGWRAAVAGYRTIVAPEAVVFHVEAAHRGARRTALTGRHTHYQERRAALYTLLANAPSRSLLWLTVRLAVGTLLRMIGLLVVRAPGEALDDLAALVSIYTRPGQIRAARRTRAAGRATAEGRDRASRLLPPWWLPYRHGLDFVGDLISAATHQAQDVADRRRAAAAEHAPTSAAPRHHSDDEEDLLSEETSLLVRFLTNPVALLLTLAVLAALVASRAAWGPLAGGGLSPAPGAAGDWWRLHLETWHPLGTGTAVPAPPYVLPLALLATLLGGSPTAAVAALHLLAMPLALWGAWRLLRVAGRLATQRGASRWLLLWGSVTWSLVPAVSGAWGDGRLGVVVVATLLPWLAHAALGFADPARPRRWHAAWRVGLLLALGSAFAPVLWLVAAALVAVVLVLAALNRRIGALAPVGLALGLPVLLLAPWWVPALRHGAAEGLLLDTGRLPTPTVAALDLLAGRLGEAGAPVWIGLVPVVLALLALVPAATRVPVLACWTVAVVSAAVAAGLSGVTLDLAAGRVGAGVGAPLMVLHGSLLVAAVLGGVGLQAAAHGTDPAAPIRRAAAWAAALAAAVVPIGGLAWWLADDPTITHGIDTDIPAYMTLSAQQGPEHGILAIRGSVESGLAYTVRRGDGITVGEDEIVDLTAEDRDFTDAVQTLVSRPTSETVDLLAAAGIEHVVLPGPADGDVAATLDAATGLVQASAGDRQTRAWALDRPLDGSSLDGPTSWLRVLLLVVQGGLAIAAVVLCLPTVSRRRGRND